MAIYLPLLAVLLIGNELTVGLLSLVVAVTTVVVVLFLAVPGDALWPDYEPSSG
jgi:hypothetical protein